MFDLNVNRYQISILWTEFETQPNLRSKYKSNPTFESNFGKLKKSDGIDSVKLDIGYVSNFWIVNRFKFIRAIFPIGEKYVLILLICGTMTISKDSV